MEHIWKKTVSAINNFFLAVAGKIKSALSNFYLAVEIDPFIDFFGDEWSTTSWKGTACEYKQRICRKGTHGTITIRKLTNYDRMLYFEVSRPRNIKVHVLCPPLKEHISHKTLYHRPAKDKRYGKNIITGPFGLCQLQTGSAFASKIYVYRELELAWKSEHSIIYRLYRETDHIKFDETGFTIHLPNTRHTASFSILLSKEKLFENVENFQKYMEYYYASVTNNNVWCSFFSIPSGTMTKLPFSVKPFTKYGYGFNLAHSSRRDMQLFLETTHERFFFDFMENAILQAYLYQKNDDGIFYTPYTSDWLKRDIGMTAPYIDTRLNETFGMMLQDFQKVSGYFPQIDAQKTYLNFLRKIYQKGTYVYRAGEGILFPDYFKYGLKEMSHASLNHQIGTALLFWNGWEKYREPMYKEISKKILLFIQHTCTDWIKDNGDLFYGVRYKENQLHYSGNDYIYVTLNDLLLLKEKLDVPEINLDTSFLDVLIQSKITYLCKTEYDVFNTNAKHAPGESIHAREHVLMRYRRVYNTH